MTSSELNAVLIRAQQLVDMGMRRDAFHTLSAFIGGHPGDAVLAHAVGKFFQSVNMPRKAEIFYLKSLDINSSQDLIYFNLGVIYQSLNEVDKALNMYAKAIEINRDYAKSYANMAYIYNKKNNKEKAREYCEIAISKDPDNPQIQHMLASIGDKEAPDSASSDYVKDVFDNYANYYDNHLIHTLKFKTPKHIYDEVLVKIGGAVPKKSHILDLGCGTGLCGELFSKSDCKITGVDLSTGMIHEARNKNIYDELYVEDIEKYITNCESAFDVVVSSDVFIYIGELKGIICQVSHVLNDNSIFVFSVETSTDSGSDYLLDNTGRYKHNKKYIHSLADQCNLKVIGENDVVLRTQDDIDVKGCIFTLTNSST